MSSIISSDFATAQQAIRSYLYYNSGTFLGLFQNNFIPRADTLLAAFIPSTFVNYSPISLAGKFSYPIKQRDAAYVSQMARQSFVCLADSSEFVCGWYLYGGGNWHYAQAFDAPIPALTLLQVNVDFALQTIGLQLELL